MLARVIGPGRLGCYPALSCLADQPAHCCRYSTFTTSPRNTLSLTCGTWPKINIAPWFPTIFTAWRSKAFSPPAHGGALFRRRLGQCLDRGLPHVAAVQPDCYNLRHPRAYTGCRRAASASGSPGARAGGPPHATWPELHALQSSGIVDVQAHTLAHAMIFCNGQPADLSPRPTCRRRWPSRCWTMAIRPVFYPPRTWHANLPLPVSLFRCPPFLPRSCRRGACRAHAATMGGHYFGQPGWEKPLQDIMRRAGGRWETAEEAQRAIAHEVGAAREILNARLKTDTVRHLCFPWAVAGPLKPPRAGPAI